MNTVIEALNRAGQWFVEFSTDMLIQASVLIAVLFVVDWFIRKRIRGVIRYWIWTLVLLKLLLPPSLISPIGLGQVIPKMETTIVTPSELPAVSATEDTLAYQMAPASPFPNPQSKNANHSLDPQIVDQDFKVKNEALLSWQGLALLIWISIVSALLLLLLQRVMLVRSLVAQGTSCDESLQTVLNECRKRLGLSTPVSFKLTPVSGSPAVCGLRRPVVLIPRDMLADLKPRDLEAVLLHELAHVIRGDLWVNLVQTLLQILYFYSPLVWLANWQIRKIREIAVDEAVLVALKDQASAYPEALVDIARLALSRPTISLRLIGVVENKSELNRRIKHMLNRPFPKTAQLGALGVVVLTCVAILLPMAGARQAATGSEPAENYLMVTGQVTDQEGRASLQGMVIDPNGRPAGNRRFWLTGDDLDPSSGVLASVTTDDAGQFTVEDVPMKLLRLACNGAHGQDVSFPFYLSQAGPWYMKLLYSSETNKTFTLKILALGREPAVLEKSVGQPWYEASGQGSIRGRVLDAKGAPVTDAVVMICDASSGIPLVIKTYRPMTDAYVNREAPKEIAFSVTDQAGRFQWADVPQGNYRLIAQSWQGAAKIKAILEKNGVEIHLHGIAENIQPGRDVEIRPLGTGSLILDQHMPNDETLVVVSTSPAQADPVLGFAGWGGPMMRHMLCGNRMPKGQTTIHGLPAGTVYLAMFAADSAPAFAEGQAEIRAGRETVVPEIQFVGSWSNARQEPPADLQVVFKELQQLPEDQLKDVAERLYKKMGMTSESQGVPWGFMRLAQPHLKEAFMLPGDRAVTLEQALSCLMYLELQRQVTRRQQKQTQVSVPVGTPGSAASNVLQTLINAAQSGDTVSIPDGTYAQPIRIDKPLTLRGNTQQGCIIKVTANEPAIFIDTGGQGEVTLENLTLQWQLATSDRNIQQPFALGIKDTKAMVKGCRFVPLGNAQRSPVALRADGFSEVTVADCQFTGFEYVICYGPGTQGIVQDCVISDCGHQGIINYTNAVLTVQRNIVTGSKFHAVRCTGGTLHVKDNLLIKNANRAIYLGNRSGSGTITNNLIVGNGTGISGFAQAAFQIRNNVLIDNDFAGVDMRDSCRFIIDNNILVKNGKGVIVFVEGTDNGNRLGDNVFWQNKTADTENCPSPGGSLTQDPLFADPGQGDYSLREGPVKTDKHGLTDPEMIRQLWVKYQTVVQ